MKKIISLLISLVMAVGIIVTPVSNTKAESYKYLDARAFYNVFQNYLVNYAAPGTGTHLRSQTIAEILQMLSEPNEADVTGQNNLQSNYFNNQWALDRQDWFNHYPTFRSRHPTLLSSIVLPFEKNNQYVVSKPNFTPLNNDSRFVTFLKKLGSTLIGNSSVMGDAMEGDWIIRSLAFEPDYVVPPANKYDSVFVAVKLRNKEDIRDAGDMDKIYATNRMKAHPDFAYSKDLPGDWTDAEKQVLQGVVSQQDEVLRLMNQQQMTASTAKAYIEAMGYVMSGMGMEGQALKGFGLAKPGAKLNRLSKAVITVSGKDVYADQRLVQKVVGKTAYLKLIKSMGTDMSSAEAAVTFINNRYQTLTRWLRNDLPIGALPDDLFFKVNIKIIKQPRILFRSVSGYAGWEVTVNPRQTYGIRLAEEAFIQKTPAGVIFKFSLTDHELMHYLRFRAVQTRGGWASVQEYFLNDKRLNEGFTEYLTRLKLRSEGIHFGYGAYEDYVEALDRTVKLSSQHLSRNPQVTQAILRRGYASGGNLQATLDTITGVNGFGKALSSKLKSIDSLQDSIEKSWGKSGYGTAKKNYESAWYGLDSWITQTIRYGVVQ